MSDSQARFLNNQGKNVEMYGFVEAISKAISNVCVFKNLLLQRGVDVYIV